MHTRSKCYLYENINLIFVYIYQTYIYVSLNLLNGIQLSDKPFNENYTYTVFEISISTNGYLLNKFIPFPCTRAENKSKG